MAKLGLEELDFCRQNDSGKKALIVKAADEVKNAILSKFNLVSDEKHITLKILSDIKSKIKEATRSDKIKVAALFSGSLTITELAENFKISHRAAWIASNLCKTNRLLTEPAKKRMETLSPSIVSSVRNFYEAAENSRIINEIHKTIVKRTNPEDGSEEVREVPKRLILSTLAELYANFRKQFPGDENKIEQTEFGMLQPSNCLLLHAGKNKVCLCIHHENIRLLYESIGIKNAVTLF